MLVRIRHLPRESALVHRLAGPDGEYVLADRLLTHIANLLAGANWQRGGGKGGRPKPIRLDGRPRKSTQERHADYTARLRNLGMIPGS